MNQNILLQQAKQGDLKSITILINRSLESKGIRSTIDSPVAGQLDIILDSLGVPSIEAAEYIFRGLQKMQPQAIYEAIVYGRQQGHLFASWSHRYTIQERPSDWVPEMAIESVTENGNSYPVSVELEDGKTLKFDLIAFMGFWGVICLLVGLFSPVMSFGPLSITFFREGSYEGILLLILAIVSAILLSIRNFVWLWATASNAGLLVILSFLEKFYKIQEIKRKLNSELSDNPFRGLADLAINSLQLQWGWIFLIGGAVLLQAALFRRSKRPPRQAYIATAVVLGLVIASVLTTPTIQAIAEQEQTNKVEQSSAKTYTSSLMRSQQVYYLEHNKFASTISELAITTTESQREAYDYSIETQNNFSVAKASAKHKGLKSYTGAVFLTKIESLNENTTLTVICESKDQTKKAPKNPELISGETKCAKDSNPI